MGPRLFWTPPIKYKRMVGSSETNEVRMVIRAVIREGRVIIEVTPHRAYSRKTTRDMLLEVPEPVDIMALWMLFDSLPQLLAVDSETLKFGYKLYRELDYELIHHAKEGWEISAVYDEQSLATPLSASEIMSMEKALVNCFQSGIKLDWKWFVEGLRAGRPLTEHIYELVCGKYHVVVPRRIRHELIAKVPECGIEEGLVSGYAAVLKLVGAEHPLALAGYHVCENMIDTIRRASCDPIIVTKLRDWQLEVTRKLGVVEGLAEQHHRFFDRHMFRASHEEILSLLDKFKTKPELNPKPKPQPRASTHRVKCTEDVKGVLKKACELKKWLANHISELPTKQQRSDATQSGIKLSQLIEDAENALSSGRTQKIKGAMARLRDFSDELEKAIQSAEVATTKVVAENGKSQEEIEAGLNDKSSPDPLPLEEIKELMKGVKGAPYPETTRSVLLHGFILKKRVSMRYIDMAVVAKELKGKGLDKGTVMQCAKWLLHHGVLEPHHPERGLLVSLSIEKTDRNMPGNDLVQMVRKALFITTT